MQYNLERSGRAGVVRDEPEIEDKISSVPSNGDIASLAYALWEERGGGDGGADQDWFEAERRLQTQRTSPKPLESEQPVSVAQEDFPISSDDELGDAGTDNRPRSLGDFKPTNVPLSAADLEYRRGDSSDKRKQAWAPRTTENIGELTPIPDDEKAKR